MLQYIYYMKLGSAEFNWKYWSLVQIILFMWGKVYVNSITLTIHFLLVDCNLMSSSCCFVADNQVYVLE